MGSLRDVLSAMEKKASRTEPDYEAIRKQTEAEVIQKLAMLKLAQELAEEEAAAEVVPEEPAIPEEEAMAEENLLGGGELSEEDIVEALTEIVENVDILSDEDKNSILESADALEDLELANGEKVSTVMDYVALLHSLGL